MYIYIYIYINVYYCKKPVDAYVYPKFPTTIWVSHIEVLKFVCAYIRHWGVEAWQKNQPNFDTGGSKFGRTFV